MAEYEVFKFWYSKGLGNDNTFANADDGRKIQNTTTAGKAIKLIYCFPIQFAKRQTDVSNALAADPTRPDTGTAASDVILRFIQERTQPLAADERVLAKLRDMFYLKSSDDIYEKGRFGLESSDNPELDVLPLPTAGYKFISFRQEPNQDSPGIQIWELHLQFLGDHTKLGTKS